MTSRGSDTATAAIFVELGRLVDEVYTAFPGAAADTIRSYLDARARREAEMQRDLLPLLVYCALTGEGPQRVVPLAAAWTLALAAGHMLDAAQDEGAMSRINDAVVALGATDIVLARLDVDADTLRDILDALGRATALAAGAQQAELTEGSIPTRTSYFARTAGKAALLIATGIWMGGRLATDDEQTLVMLKEFGLAEGMAIQIADDCEDLVSDLMMGVYTLPVIEGMDKRDDWRHSQLGELLNEKPVSRQRAEQVVALLAEMGALARARQVADAYMGQAKTIFGVLPGLEPFFASRSSA